MCVTYAYAWPNDYDDDDASKTLTVKLERKIQNKTYAGTHAHTSQHCIARLKILCIQFLQMRFINDEESPADEEKEGKHGSSNNTNQPSQPKVYAI